MTASVTRRSHTEKKFLQEVWWLAPSIYAALPQLPSYVLWNVTRRSPRSIKTDYPDGVVVLTFQPRRHLRLCLREVEFATRMVALMVVRSHSRRRYTAQWTLGISCQFFSVAPRAGAMAKPAPYFSPILHRGTSVRHQT